MKIHPTNIVTNKSKFINLNQVLIGTKATITYNNKTVISNNSQSITQSDYIDYASYRP